MSAKEIYDRRKRLRQERMLRNEEYAAMRDTHEEDGELLFAALVSSVERIADALVSVAVKMEGRPAAADRESLLALLTEAREYADSHLRARIDAALAAEPEARG